MQELKFDAMQIEGVFAEYKLQSKLGKGAYGQAYLVTHRTTNEQSALKKISCFGLDDRQRTYALNEMRILASLSHPNLIQFHSGMIDSSKDELYIFMQYASEGDLALLIDTARASKRRIAEHVVWHVLMDMSSVLQYLHTNKIIHRDIKPANIFCSKNSVYKLGDLNASKIMANGALARTQAGSPLYIGPEVWREDEGGYNEKCDIWSLGIVAYEMCFFSVPFEAQSIEELRKKQLLSCLKNIPRGYSLTLTQTIHEMLRVRPQSRLSAAKLRERCMNYMKVCKEESTERVDELMKTLMFREEEQKTVILPTINAERSKSRDKSREKNMSSSRERPPSIFAPIENKSMVPRSKQGKNMLCGLPPVRKQHSQNDKSKECSKRQRSGSRQSKREEKDTEIRTSKNIRKSSKEHGEQ